MRRLLIAGLVAAAGILTVTSCESDPGEVVTLYNGQHESTTKALVEAFTEKTGIRVEIRSGSDSELANQIVQEGADSPADVIYTENTPALNLLESRGLLADLDEATRSQVPVEFSGDHWVGVAGRSTVLVYNPDLLPERDLPESLMELAEPAWRGKFAIAPAGADFQAIVSAVIANQGEERAAAWLAGLKSNAETYQNNIAILQAVNAGEIAAGITYHYYWYRDQAESGEISDDAALHFFGNQDPGAFISVSGAGVLASSQHQQAAKALVEFLSGPEGQRVLAESDDLEYPLGDGVKANAALKPFDELEPPAISPVDLGDGTPAVDLMHDAGLL